MAEVRSASLLNMSLFRRCFFTHFASKNQLPGFSISGTLAGNGLKYIEEDFRIFSVDTKLADDSPEVSDNWKK